MEDWRQVARQLLPSAISIIDSAGNPIALWNELADVFFDAYSPKRQEVIDGTFGYAKWCLRSKDADVGIGVKYGFLEHVPQKAFELGNPVYGDIVRDAVAHFTIEELDALEDVFRNFVDAEQWKRFRSDFRDAARGGHKTIHRRRADQRELGGA